MFDAEQYIAEYQALEHGAPRLRAIQKAYRAADEAHNDEWSFQFRYRYLNESTFECDDVDALIIFPEMIAIYDRNEELQADDDVFQDLMWAFKLIIENSAKFHHIPLEQIDSYFEEFKRRLEAAGKSLRTYYFKREDLSELTGNLLPEEEYGKYRDLPADELKDCNACELSHDVRIALLHEKPEKAREIGAPIFSGEMHCGEVPENTFAAWIRYDIRHAEYGDARKLAKRLWPMVRHRMDMLCEIGTLLHLYSIIDRQSGITVFRHEVRNFINCRNHWMRMKFAFGAYKLFSRVEVEAFNAVMPRECPFWNAEHHYETAKMRDFFYEEAKQLAEKFDARNGNTVCTDMLNAEDPEYDGEAADMVYGFAEQMPSAIGAVCTELPETLTVDSISDTLDADGRFKVVLHSADSQEGMIALQIAEGDGSANIHQVIIVCQPVPPVQEFRPASPIAEDVADAVTNAEGMVLCVMPFEDVQPDLALHFQLKLLNLLCPGAVAYLDLSRMKLLPAGWVTLAAHSEVPPLVDYLYNLQIRGSQDDEHLWISTQGLRCCGLRELEILDATKENYPRYCDMLCFAAERILLRGEMSNAGEPFTVVRKADDTDVVCTWVPFSEAAADYPDDNAGGRRVRMEYLGDSAAEFDDNAVLFLAGNEKPDGSRERIRLNAITDEMFSQFWYGNYIATARKTAALAKERYPIFAALFEKMPENAYVCIREKGGDGEELWVKVTAAEEHKIEGLLADDCGAGKAGDKVEASPEQLLDFSVRLDENLIVHPNTAYIALEIE